MTVFTFYILLLIHCDTVFILTIDIDYILLKYNGIIYYIIAINYFEVGKTSVTSLLFIKRFLTALIQFLIQVKSNTRLAIIINHLAFCLECALICVKYVQIALQI